MARDPRRLTFYHDDLELSRNRERNRHFNQRNQARPQAIQWRNSRPPPRISIFDDETLDRLLCNEIWGTQRPNNAAPPTYAYSGSPPPQQITSRIRSPPPDYYHAAYSSFSNDFLPGPRLSRQDSAGLPQPNFTNTPQRYSTQNRESERPPRSSGSMSRPIQGVPEARAPPAAQPTEQRPPPEGVTTTRTPALRQLMEQALRLPNSPQNVTNMLNQAERRAAIRRNIPNQMQELKRQKQNFIAEMSTITNDINNLVQARNLSTDDPQLQQPSTSVAIEETAYFRDIVNQKMKSLNDAINILDGILGKEASEANLRNISPDRNHRINVVHYDSHTHWCRDCDVFPLTAPEYLSHLLSSEHSMKVARHVESPWHHIPNLNAGFPKHSSAPPVQVPISGLQFYVPATGFYCKLCNMFAGDMHCALAHVQSIEHNKNYVDFVERTPLWEAIWLSARQEAMESVKAEANRRQIQNETAKSNKKEATKKKVKNIHKKKPRSRSSSSSSSDEGISKPRKHTNLHRFKQASNQSNTPSDPVSKPNVNTGAIKKVANVQQEKMPLNQNIRDKSPQMSNDNTKSTEDNANPSSPKVSEQHDESPEEQTNSSNDTINPATESPKEQEQPSEPVEEPTTSSMAENTNTSSEPSELQSKEQEQLNKSNEDSIASTSEVNNNTSKKLIGTKPSDSNLKSSDAAKAIIVYNKKRNNVTDLVNGIQQKLESKNKTASEAQPLPPYQIAATNKITNVQPLEMQICQNNVQSSGSSSSTHRNTMATRKRTDYQQSQHQNTMRFGGVPPASSHSQNQLRNNNTPQSSANVTTQKPTDFQQTRIHTSNNSSNNPSGGKPRKHDNKKNNNSEQHGRPNQDRARRNNGTGPSRQNNAPPNKNSGKASKPKGSYDQISIAYDNEVVIEVPLNSDDSNIEIEHEYSIVPTPNVRYQQPPTNTSPNSRQSLPVSPQVFTPRHSIITSVQVYPVEVIIERNISFNPSNFIGNYSQSTQPAPGPSMGYQPTPSTSTAGNPQTYARNTNNIPSYQNQRQFNGNHNAMPPNSQPRPYQQRPY